MIRVSIKLDIADNESRNVNLPVNELKENAFANDNKRAYVFLKIDPSKENWGDITMQVRTKLSKTTAVTTSSYSTGGWSGGSDNYSVSWNGGGWNSTGVGTGDIYGIDDDLNNVS